MCNVLFCCLVTCPANCAACSSSTTCTSCSAGYFLKNGACQTCTTCTTGLPVSLCCGSVSAWLFPAACCVVFCMCISFRVCVGQYAAIGCSGSADTTCNQCDTGCAACSGPGGCTQCQSGYTLANGVCNPANRMLLSLFVCRSIYLFYIYFGAIVCLIDVTCILCSDLFHSSLRHMPRVDVQRVQRQLLPRIVVELSIVCCVQRWTVCCHDLFNDCKHEHTMHKCAFVFHVFVSLLL